MREKQWIFWNFALTSAGIHLIYIYASKSSHYALSENCAIYSGLIHSSRDTENQNIKKAVSAENLTEFFNCKC